MERALATTPFLPKTSFCGRYVICKTMLYHLSLSRKFKDPMVIKPSHSLSERIKSLSDHVSVFADELDEVTEKVTQFWLTQPTIDSLHILVKVRDAG